MTLRSPESVLVLAPFGRDAEVAAGILRERGFSCVPCPDVPDLVDLIRQGAGFAIVTEDVLQRTDVRPLSDWIGQQPEWSDFPFILLTHRGGGIERNPAAARLLETLGNVTFLERPFHPTTLVSVAEAAIRARRRQYEARATLEELRHLNETLEARVASAIAEQQHTEAALRQAQKMEAVGQLTGGVAHDFNNLLMAISGGLSMLSRGPLEPTREKKIRDGMRQAVERGTALTRQLLAFSRRRPLEPVPINLNVQLDGMRELLERSLRGDVDVDMTFEDSLWPIDVDPGELELAVLNLCVNARDAMPQGGVIRLMAFNDRSDAPALKGDVVRLVIQDTGDGMSEEVLAHAFEPFFTTKDVGKGSGLGLAQVYAFLRQSAGDIRIDSRLGKGTSITLVFPRSMRAVTARAEDAGAEPAAPAAQAMGNVLLVEDDSEVGALTSEMLQSLGYSVTHVSSPAAALGALANGRDIHIVFSDVMMPGGMNGVELAREIRRRRPDMPVLLATGFVDAAQGAIRDGFEVMAKPYQMDDLAHSLESVRRAQAWRRSPAST